jgi:hypothetical protein
MSPCAWTLYSRCRSCFIWTVHRTHHEHDEGSCIHQVHECSKTIAVVALVVQVHGAHHERSCIHQVRECSTAGAEDTLFVHCTVLISVADPDPGSGIRCFFTPRIRDTDPGSGMEQWSDPDPGSGISKQNL